MKKTKIIVSLVLILTMALYLCACGKNKNTEEGMKKMENTLVKITMEDEREIISNYYRNLHRCRLNFS